MRLYHTCPSEAFDSIMENGIDPAYSQGKMQAVWLHSQDKQSWAFLHCVRRHGGRVENVVSLEVQVDPEKVKRSSSEGLFYTLELIRPEYICRVIGFRVVSRSPLEKKHG